MSAAHTPGPWFVDEDPRPGMTWNRQIMSDAATTICFMANSGGENPEEDAANAQLLAMAPVLLAALQACERLFSKALPKFNWGASFLDANAIRLLNEVPAVAREAVAKATGSAS